MDKSLLKFMTCGSVDDGKSTLIGRLLYDSNNIFSDQIESLELISKKYGTQKENIDFALLVDGLQSEREQGITIDVAYRYFNTSKRKFILADTPGHEQYTRNMATAASNTDVAIILIDATKGVSLQTKRHSYITTLFGIKNLIVAINKMDLISYSEEVFHQIKEDFKSALNTLKTPHAEIAFIPVCATDGDNIVTKSQNTPWYKEHTLLDILEEIKITDSANNSLRFPIQYINRPNKDFRGYMGTLINGTLHVEDKIKILPSNKTTTIKEIITYEGKLKSASSGDAITLTLHDEIDINRGDMIVLSDDNSISLSDRFEAMIVWMDEENLTLNKNYQLNIYTQSVNAKITNIEFIKDMKTLQNFKEDFLKLNDIAKCTLQTDKKIAIDKFENIKETGSFIFIDKITNKTSAAGVVIEVQKSKNENIFLHHHTITKELRTKNLAQKPMIIWFTGLSASGKSTLANELEKALYMQGFKTYLLDGDNLRNTLNSDLGFSQKEREENIRRVAHLSQIMLDAGLIVITAFISPFAKDREFARSLV
ncbi:MAG: sulfate adenylyltransferase subunit CysN, partial [Sulfurimonas sp.]|nr:sulfate adenylyltransferase subunit CysN [Sulfurimonas sp.]